MRYQSGGNDLSWWRSVGPVRAAVTKGACAMPPAGTAVSTVKQTASSSDVEHATTHAARLPATHDTVPPKRCRLRGARVRRDNCVSSAAAASMAVAHVQSQIRAPTDGPAIVRGQQQRDGTHGNHSFTGGRQPQEQLAPEQDPQSQRFDVFDNVNLLRWLTICHIQIEIHGRQPPALHPVMRRGSVCVKAMTERSNARNLY